MHHSYESIAQKDIGNGWTSGYVIVEDGDTAENPAGSRLIYGPAKVTYETAPSGSITAIVEDVVSS